MISFYLELFIFIKFITMILGGWFSTLVMRGATSKTFVLSLMLCDFVLFLIFGQGYFIANVIYGVDPVGW